MKMMLKGIDMRNSGHATRDADTGTSVIPRPVSGSIHKLQSLARGMSAMLVLMLAACATEPQTTPQAHGPVEFMDLQSFDNRLSGSLANKTGSEPVEVTFIDRVSPNELPKRLQRWLAEVENSGGRIKVVPAPGELTPKDPLFLLSLVGGVLNGLKGLEYVREERMFKKAADYDADIQIRRNLETGGLVVEKVKFKKRESTKQ